MFKNTLPRIISIILCLLFFLVIEKSEANHISSPKEIQQIVITIGTIPSPLCAGDTVKIPYSFIGGKTILGNRFTVYLSDSAGGFSKPTQIGNVLDTSTIGTITVVIPLNTPSDTRYRFRVGSTLPNITGADNGFDVQIKAAPRVAILRNDTTCLNSTQLITGVTVSNYETLLWSTRTDGSFSSPTTLTTTYTHGPNEGTKGYVYLILTATSSCGSKCDSVKLIINKPPTVNASNDTLICWWRKLVLKKASASNYDSLRWTTSGGGKFDNAYLLHSTYTPDTNDYKAGAVTLTLTAYKNTCFPVSDNMTVTFKSMLYAFAGLNDTICVGVPSVNLSSSVLLNYDSLLWSTSGTGTFDNKKIEHPTYTVSKSDTTRGYANLILTTYTSSCGIYYDTMRLSIFSLPHLYAGKDTIICQLDTFKIKTARADNYQTAKWTTTGFGHFVNPNTLYASYIPSTLDASLDTVRLIVTIGSQCAKGLTDTMYIKVHNKANPNLADSTVGCMGQELKIMAEGNITKYWSYKWSNGITFPTVAIVADVSKKYKVTVTNVCGSVVDSIQIQVHPTPELVVCKDTTIDFMFPAQLWAIGGASYTWTPSIGLNDTTINNPLANPANSTKYYVTAWDELHGCAVRDSVNVNVFIRDYQIYLPSAFTPNKGGGDGQNDVFRPLPLGLFGFRNYKMEIYNRWGKMIFESTNPSEGWDGYEHKNNTPYDIDAYLYKVTAVDPYNIIHVKTGSVVLLK